MELISQTTIAPPRITPFELYNEWLDQLVNPLTRRVYVQGWTFFAVANRVSLKDAIDRFFSDGPSNADSMCAVYKTYMLRKSLAGKTINTRLSTIICLLSYARRKRLLFWDLEIARLDDKPIKDMRGPSEERIKFIFTTLENKFSVVGFRDLAMTRLMYNPALRTCEVLGLDLEHIDMEASQVRVLGKSRNAREWITMPPTTKSALELWLEVRPVDIDNPAVFVAVGGGCYGQRVTNCTVTRIGRQFAFRPHGLRHSAITKALDITDGDIRSVQKFARHATPKQVLAYDDCRRDLGGNVANLLDEA